MGFDVEQAIEQRRRQRDLEEIEQERTNRESLASIAKQFRSMSAAALRQRRLAEDRYRAASEPSVPGREHCRNDQKLAASGIKWPTRSTRDAATSAKSQKLYSPHKVAKISDPVRLLAALHFPCVA
jgi:hypothetical protein